MRRRSNEFIQFQLKGDLLATLGVLNDEQHHQRDRGRDGGEADFPVTGEALDAQDDDEQEHDEGDQRRRAGPRGDLTDPMKEPADALLRGGVFHDASLVLRGQRGRWVVVR